MTHRSIFSILLAAILILSCTTAFSADQKAEKSRIVSKAARAAKGALMYSFAPEDHSWPSGNQTVREPLGVTSFSSAGISPGVDVGGTYYTYQHNGSMGRMIGIGPYDGYPGEGVVHFSWMYLPEPIFESRSYAYSSYTSKNHTVLDPVILHDPSHQYSGYVNIEVTKDNRAIVGGHCDLMLGAQHYMGQFHFDACSNCADFTAFSRIPDSLAADEEGDESAMWPKFFLQYGSDTVLHVITLTWDDYAAQTYYRCVGWEGTGVWDEDPYIIDSVQVSAHDITGQRSGDRLAISWFASLPYSEPSCDTCSDLTFYDGLLVGQMDNDVYYQISTDQGQTWEPRVNVTKSEIGEAVYKAYCDLSVLFDQNSKLHIVWGAQPWTADTCIDSGGSCWDPDWPLVDPTRIFHWAEDLPYIRTVADVTWQPSDSCGPPHFWSTQATKMSVSECHNKLYTIWSQYNDVPNGIDDDCSFWGYDNDQWQGTANGEIWLAVSSDGGMTWDAPRNLTNSYTPNCNPHGGIECQSDVWPSMSEWGRQNQPGEDWTEAVVVDPSGGSSPTDYYLDIQYVNDLDAGVMLWENEPQGTWTYNPIKWFRIPCVEPVPAPNFAPQYWSIADPAWGKPGVQIDTSFMIENNGNVPLLYSIIVEEDNGTSGWLSVSEFSGTIVSGLGNVETGNIHLNTGGVQSSQINLLGRLIFNGNDPSFPDTIEIEFIVADTLIAPVWASVTNSCLSLTCSNHGNAGHGGIGKENMDFYPNDCDESENAEVYLYEGSVILGRDGGANFNSIFWGNSYLDDDGFRPLGGQSGAEVCIPLDASIVESGTFTDQDSTIGLTKVWITPNDDCEFIIEYLRVWSLDGQTHTGLAIGEANDWDIPWDYLETDPDSNRTAVNTGSFDPTRFLFYQSGYESDDMPDCQVNTDRFGGHAFIEAFFNTTQQSAPYSGFIGENDEMLATIEGFKEDLMWTGMQNPEFTGSDSTEDLHTMMTFHNDLTIGATDEYEVVTVLATVHEGTLDDLKDAVDRAITWYTANGGISIFVDDNDNGFVDACEYCCVINGDFNDDADLSGMDAVFFVNYLWNEGPQPPCMDAADANGDESIGGMDVVYLVNYLWNEGPAPVLCP